MLRRSFLFLGGALLARNLPIASSVAAQPIQVRKREIYGVPFYQATIDLADPFTYLSIGLANQARRANSSRISYGDEPFPSFVSRLNAALVVSGTFFSLDARKQVMGNMVSGGRFLKYVPWENYGTTLGIGPGKRLQMITARVDGKPAWHHHWFSLTAGPRLLRHGRIWLAPRTEGFEDPRVLGVARRAAAGFTAGGRTLVLATFLSSLSLQKEAQIMRAIGCREALNLDGGSSLGFAHHNQLLVRPSRQLTNVIAVYDRWHPATSELQESWSQFNRGKRRSLPSASI
jgi:hypothetical protein